MLTKRANELGAIENLVQLECFIIILLCYATTPLGRVSRVTLTGSILKDQVHRVHSASCTIEDLDMSLLMHLAGKVL